MNKRIMRITAIMIIILVVILVAIFAQYLSKSESYNTTKKPYSSNASGEKNTPSTPSNYTLSGNNSGSDKEDNKDLIIEESNQNEVINDVAIDTKENKDEGKKGEKVNDKEKEQTPVVKEDENINIESDSSSGEDSIFKQTITVEVGDNKQEPVISSNSETSNQEKQQVLNEIDDALQGLLEAVSKVPVVDETKLDASLESEVQP